MRREKLSYDIVSEYSPELNDINNKLKQLEKGRIYELSGVQMDGYLATNVKQLRDMIGDLLAKIQEGEPGKVEALRKASEIMSSILK